MSSDDDPEVLPLPAGWRSPRGYANAVAARGRQIFIAGQVGWDPATEAIVSDEFAAQAEQALRNIRALLDAAGAEPRHLVRLNWYVTDPAAYQAARREIAPYKYPRRVEFVDALPRTATGKLQRYRLRDVPA